MMMMPFVRLEAVHLDEKLVQRLLALVVAAAEARAAMPTDASISSMKMMQGAFFFAWSNMSRTRLGADAHEHLDEVRSGDGEERHVRLAGDGTRDQRLTGAGRADEEAAARNAAAEPLELLRVAQELDDLLQVVLGLVDAGHVLEGDAAMRLRQQLRLGLAEAHGAAGTGLHLAAEKIQAPMKTMMGSQLTRRAMNQGVDSPAGRAVICTPFSRSRVTSCGSKGA
jgi:hypothetical protein